VVNLQRNRNAIDHSEQYRGIFFKLFSCDVGDDVSYTPAFSRLPSCSPDPYASKCTSISCQKWVGSSMQMSKADLSLFPAFHFILDGLVAYPPTSPYPQLNNPCLLFCILPFHRIMHRDWRSCLRNGRSASFLCSEANVDAKVDRSESIEYFTKKQTAPIFVVLGQIREQWLMQIVGVVLISSVHNEWQMFCCRQLHYQAGK